MNVFIARIRVGVEHGESSVEHKACGCSNQGRLATFTGHKYGHDCCEEAQLIDLGDPLHAYVQIIGDREVLGDIFFVFFTDTELE